MSVTSLRGLTQTEIDQIQFADELSRSEANEIMRTSMRQRKLSFLDNLAASDPNMEGFVNTETISIIKIPDKRRRSESAYLHQTSKRTTNLPTGLILSKKPTLFFRRDNARQRLLTSRVNNTSPDSKLKPPRHQKPIVRTQAMQTRQASTIVNIGKLPTQTLTPANTRRSPSQSRCARITTSSPPSSSSPLLFEPPTATGHMIPIIHSLQVQTNSPTIPISKRTFMMPDLAKPSFSNSRTQQRHGSTYMPYKRYGPRAGSILKPRKNLTICDKIVAKALQNAAELPLQSKSMAGVGEVWNSWDVSPRFRAESSTEAVGFGEIKGSTRPKKPSSRVFRSVERKGRKEHDAFSEGTLASKSKKRNEHGDGEIN